MTYPPRPQPRPPLSLPPDDHDRIKALERISRTTVDEMNEIKRSVSKIDDNLDEMRKDMKGIVNSGLAKGTAASGGIFLLVDMIGKQLDKAPPLAITIVLSLLAVSVPLGVLALILIKRHRRSLRPPAPDDIELQ